MDENRAADGVALRDEYLKTIGRISVGPQDDLPCSILEMLIALAMRCNDWVICDVDNHYSEWFWTFLNNLGLKKFDNHHFNEALVDRILSDWLDRRYSFDGAGGLFPLRNPETDQTRVEIWGQMGYYLNENYF